MTMLTLDSLEVFYGRSQALFGVDLSLEQGELIALLGANGAGKSTVLRTISGLLKPTSGNIEFQGKKIDGLPPHQVVKLGISQVPEGRELFTGLTVEDNLRGGQFRHKNRLEKEQNWERVIEWFPILRDRLNQVAGTLSGGEQQMLAIARAFLANPQLLLLDEPSLGLSPLLVENIFQAVSEMNRSTGLTILVAEQNVNSVLSITQRGYVLELGKVAKEGKAQDLMTDQSVMESYLGKG